MFSKQQHVMAANKATATAPHSPVNRLCLLFALCTVVSLFPGAARSNIASNDVTRVGGWCSALDDTDWGQWVGTCTSAAEFTTMKSAFKLKMTALVAITADVDATTAPQVTNPGGTTRAIESFTLIADSRTTEADTPFAHPSWPVGTAYKRMDSIYHFGGTSTQAGNAAVSSYVATGGRITFADNHFPFFKLGDNTNTFTQDGVFCVTPKLGSVANTASCPVERVATPGMTKFSVFINTVGNTWTTKTTGADKHIALRLNLETHSTTNLHFNNDPAITTTSIGQKDVTHITFVPQGETSYTMDFSQYLYYNTGGMDTTTAPPIPNPFEKQVATDVQSREVHVKYVEVGGDAFLDFVFGDELRSTNTYVVYDPSVAADESSSSNSLSTPAYVGIGVGAAVLVAIMAVVIVKKKKSSLSG